MFSFLITVNILKQFPRERLDFDGPWFNVAWHKNGR